MSNPKIEKSEYVLEKQNKFITKYGTTTNTDNPSVVYLRTKSKITPLVLQKDYNNNVQEVKQRFSDYVVKVIKESKYFDNNFFYNLDISEKSVRYGKVSFLRYDIYLKPNVHKSLLKHQRQSQNLSERLDKRLEKLLKLHHISCV